MREWLSGGVSPCQGEGRGFESRLALIKKINQYVVLVYFFGEPAESEQGMSGYRIVRTDKPCSNDLGLTNCESRVRPSRLALIKKNKPVRCTGLFFGEPAESEQGMSAYRIVRTDKPCSNDLVSFFLFGFFVLG